jgi:hypothetical protein
MYAQGEGVPQNNKLAYVWSSLTGQQIAASTQKYGVPGTFINNESSMQLPVIQALATNQKGNTLKIRKSTESERDEILNIHNQAFGKDKGPEIAKLVNDLLNDETTMPILSLVAVENDKLVGHILYTKVTVTKTENFISAQILAPLAILPDEQKKVLAKN